MFLYVNWFLIFDNIKWILPFLYTTISCYLSGYYVFRLHSFIPPKYTYSYVPNNDHDCTESSPDFNSGFPSCAVYDWGEDIHEDLENKNQESEVEVLTTSTWEVLTTPKLREYKTRVACYECHTLLDYAWAWILHTFWNHTLKLINIDMIEALGNNPLFSLLFQAYPHIP